MFDLASNIINYEYMEGDLDILPKRPAATKENAFQRKERFITNHYRVSIAKNPDLYQYVLDSEPSIPDDSIPLLRDLVKSSKEILVNTLGLITHKGKVLWGLKSIDKPLVLKSKANQQNYEVIIKMTRCFKEIQIAKLSGKALKEVLQVYNVAFKEKIIGLGLKQITKGRFFHRQTREDESTILDDINIEVLRVFEMRLVPIMRGLTIQVDVGSRILRVQNFLETLSRVKSIDEKKLFIGSIVQSNYGNRNSYKIINIDFTQNPTSQFYQSSRQQKLSYQKYYQESYKIKIRELKQPLLEVVIKTTYQIKEGKKVKIQQKGFLIPQLVRLVGIPDNLRSDKRIMRKLADTTKILPLRRYQLSRDLISEFNQQKGDLYIGKPIEVEGFQLPNPIFITSNEQRSDNGVLNIKSKLKQPMRLKKKEWILAYSNLSNTQQEDYQADDLLNGFRQAQEVFGITIQDPKFVTIQKDGVQEWKKAIRKDFDGQVVILLYFHNRESRYYGELKKFLINELKTPSQVLLRKTAQGKSAISVFSKVICQINAKVGRALWTVPPKHPFWKDKSICCGGLSLSGGRGGHTLAFVGTYSSDLSKTFANSRTRLPPRQQISEKVYQDILVDWIKRYYQLQKRMPPIIVLYREGLSTEQAQIQSQKELSALFKVVERAAKKEPGYKPQIIYIVVGKRINTRFYAQHQEQQRAGKFQPSIENPPAGSIVFQPLSRENAYDFHLAAQRVTFGNCTPTHFRIAYDSSQVPQEAIVQLTYEQCYNYFNWFGSVRVPGCLQSADKLSKLVGEHVREDTISSELLKTPFFL